MSTARRWSLRVRWTRTVSVFATGLLLAGVASGTATAQSAQGDRSAQDPAVRLTWSSISNWVVDTGDTRILIDAYYTRAAQPLKGQAASPLFTREGTGLPVASRTSLPK